VLFLTGVPIDDTGGGARGTQIALELLQRGHLVVFVHKYPKQESVELNLDFDHPNLLHFPLADFDWKALKWELHYLLKEKPLTAILEFPFKEFLPIIRDVERLDGKIVYDLIDEWKTSLGGEWYSEKVERSIIERSHVLAASAPPLVKRLETASKREVLWLPNAVNLRLFDRHQAYKVPEDLPKGSPKILYIGALWGEWFDWELLQKIAQSNPDGAVVVVGDYRGQSPFRESNVYFLGLKPQTILPAYLQYSDVAIIPWKIGPITQATSPLKIFEYLAMGIPVVAPKLRPLEGIPYVFLSQDHEAFLKNITLARDCKMEEHVLDDFLRQNSWQARMDRLAEWMPDFSRTGSVDDGLVEHSGRGEGYDV
jgi:glycosyltransferase involved in cell wall biosynthesis